MLEILGTHSLASNILAQEHNICFYHPPIVPFLEDSIPAAILLHRIIYWAIKSENHFYKFKIPCSHRLYKPGDSWCEELGFSKKNFDTALKKIGSPYNPNKDSEVPDNYVLYYTDIQRLTWYMVNWTKVNNLLEQAFSRKSRKGIYVNPERGFRKIPKGDLVYIDTKHTNKTNNIITATHKNQKIESDIHTKTDILIDDDNFDIIQNPTNTESIKLLCHYGISLKDAEKISSLHSHEFIKNKLKIVENKFVSGKINNLQGYIIHILNKETETLSEFENNLINKKQISEQKKKQEILKKDRLKKIEEEENKEFTQKTDILLTNATMADYRGFKKWLENTNGLVYKKYLSDGIKSLIVEVYLRKYLYETYCSITEKE